MRKTESIMVGLVRTVMDKCISAGCNDQETDRLMENLFIAYDALGTKAAEAVARHITDMNPDYTLSSNPKILARQIEGWL